MTSWIRKLGTGTVVALKNRVRWPFAVAGIAVLLVGGLTLAGKYGRLDLPSLHAPRPMAQAAQMNGDIQAKSTEARAQVELGHTLFSQKRVRTALKAYDLALTLNRDSADDVMVQNLVGTFGQPEQNEAAQLIRRFKLVHATPGLKQLASSKSSKVRWGAVHTLDRLGTVSKEDFVAAWTSDLDAHECGVRKHAVEELGRDGNTNTLASLRTAQQKDQKTKLGGFLGLFTHTCLGDAPEQAEKRIQARAARIARAPKTASQTRAPPAS
jgi:hypothetical protein